MSTMVKALEGNVQLEHDMMFNFASILVFVEVIVIEPF